MGHACFVSCLRPHPGPSAAALTRPPHECADRRWCSACPWLRLRCSCLCVWACTAGHADTTDCPGAWAVTPSFPFVALHSVAQPSATGPADSPLHCVPFHCRKLRRHGGEMLAALARSCVRKPATPRDELSLRSSGWHEAPPSPTVLTALRAWGDALRRPVTRHKSCYAQSRPDPGTRSAGPPGSGSRRLIASARVRPARFIGHNSVLCPLTR